MTHIRSVGIAGLLMLAMAGTAAAWGAAGHEMIGRVAAEGLPSSMPRFFTGAIDQLAYLNPEPDRWRERDLRAMDEAFKYDHYIDLEYVPTGALDAPDRFAFLEALYAAGIEDPQVAVGFLPYRMLELQQRLTLGFARWRRAESDRERAWIEQRILNDAGVLGHYVADASNPHHSTIHFNGWSDDAPNPEGYTTDRDFHWRFESAFVGAHITPQELRRAVPQGVTRIDDVRAAVLGYVRETNEHVVPLYELEKRYGFDPEAVPDPALERFTLDRLAAGAGMLRALWYTAWVDSEALARAWGPWPAASPSQDPPIAPWAGLRLSAAEVPTAYLTARGEAENREWCALLAFDDPPLPGGAEARVRTAEFAGGWGVAYDLPELRSAFGVAGTGVEPGPDTYDDWPHHQVWRDGSQAGYGPEGGSGPKQLAYLRIEGQRCLYNVWSHLGRSHLEELLGTLRFVGPLIETQR